MVNFTYSPRAYLSGPLFRIPRTVYVPPGGINIKGVDITKIMAGRICYLSARYVHNKYWLCAEEGYKYLNMGGL